ncbi:MAG: FkbM family methyltransferase [Gammaproteobacteria bacterium]|nr:FkbM family methyltransferase [Gammaproteobacteria bacterium]
MLFERVKNSIQFRYKSYRYNRFCDGVARPEFDYGDLTAQGYYSQCGQDKWLLENLFRDQQSGTFVDIGAHDGVSFSNTYRMEQVGWQGLAIEPMPEAFEKLQNNRSCITVNGCVSDSERSAKFRLITGYSQMLSGLVEEYDERHLQRIDRELEIHGGSRRDIDVECFRLDRLCGDHNFAEIDFLNLDVEGAELTVLKSIDFSALTIRVIAVENNYADYRIPSLLSKFGFSLHSIAGDEIYVNSNSFTHKNRPLAS